MEKLLTSIQVWHAPQDSFKRDMSKSFVERIRRGHVLMYRLLDGSKKPVSAAAVTMNTRTMHPLVLSKRAQLQRNPDVQKKLQYYVELESRFIAAMNRACLKDIVRGPAAEKHYCLAGDVFAYSLWHLQKRVVAQERIPGIHTVQIMLPPSVKLVAVVQAFADENDNVVYKVCDQPTFEWNIDDKMKKFFKLPSEAVSAVVRSIEHHIYQ